MLIKIAIAGGAVVVLMLILALAVRRSHRSTDSIGRYSRAVGALRQIAAEPRPEVASETRTDNDGGRLVHLLAETGPQAPSRSRRATGRRTGRPDPELVARRPVIAQLPSISAPRPDSTPQAG